MTARETAASFVPVIDIAPFLHGNANDKRAVAARVAAACERVGFFVVSGHGVSESLIARMHAVSRAFYDLPEAIKQTSASGDPKVYRGYYALGGLAAANSMENRKAAPDYREMYTVSRPVVDRSNPYFDSELARKLFVPNIWPTAIPGFEETWTEYYAVMERFSRVLLHICALGLELPEDWFDDKFDKHMSTMAVTNYPEQIVAPEPGQLRCGAHTDYGALTAVMSEDKPGGLEVLRSDGEWDPVPMIPGAFIINVGDLLQRWTNDRWRSSLHRVANPERSLDVDSRRQSLIYFCHPNYDTDVACIPSCVGNGGAKYLPITTYEHLYAKINKMQDVARETAE